MREDLYVIRPDDERLLAYEIGGDSVAVVMCGGVPVRNDLLFKSTQGRT